MNELLEDIDVSDIRKNQQQVDANGNKVGNNRPDLQWKVNVIIGKSIRIKVLLINMEKLLKIMILME